MKTASWLRIAAGLTTVQLLGHVFGAVLAGPTQGAEEVALRHAMREYRVRAMGMERTYWDFYFGSGWIITAFLATLVVVMWYTARIARDAPMLARPLVASLAIGYAVVTVICALFFVTAPIVIAATITACLVAAFVTVGTARGRA
jgi:hypothetical protein